MKHPAMRYGVFAASSLVAVLMTSGVNASTERSTAPVAAEVEQMELAARASAAPVLFHFDLSFDRARRGRNMKSPTGVFCMTYTSTHNENPPAQPYVEVTLVKNRTLQPDDRLEMRRIPNNGRQSTHCWPPHDRKSTYHFDYLLPTGYYQVKAYGTVTSR